MKKIKYGLIIAAGKQKRFKEDLPKALVNINGNCLLDINYNNLLKYCENVFVVCSQENQSYFDNIYNKIIIESGFGSGDAILKAFHKLQQLDRFNKEDKCFIIWGDSLVNENLYRELIKCKLDNTCIIPCIYENNPYVELIQCKDNIKVLFSKYGDKISSGYHDMSVFYCSVKYLYSKLNKFYTLVYNEENKCYNHIHGNEFEFLDIFNDVDCNGKILEISKQLKTFSFNTIDELTKYKESINGN